MYTSPVADFRDLRVWQSAHRLALDCYQASEGWPPGERYGLTSQVRRAAVSIGANIAEGSGRGSDRDFARFVRIALGSTNEIESLLLMAEGLGYLEPNDHRDLHRSTRQVRQMLNGLVASLNRD